ncbi:hypothetical protein YC2023_044087 [Brassica napus]
MRTSGSPLPDCFNCLSWNLRDWIVDLHCFDTDLNLSRDLTGSLSKMALPRRGAAIPSSSNQAIRLQIQRLLDFISERFDI